MILTVTVSQNHSSSWTVMVKCMNQTTETKQSQGGWMVSGLVYTQQRERRKQLNQTDGRTEGEPQEKAKSRLSREEKVKSIKKLSGTGGLVWSLHSLILLPENGKMTRLEKRSPHLVLTKGSREKAELALNLICKVLIHLVFNAIPKKLQRRCKDFSFKH